MNNASLRRTITVSGQGSANAVPELFQINVGIEALRDTVREAYTAAAEALGAVQKKLSEHQVSAESMTSTALDVRAETRWQDGGGSVVTGYTVSSTLNVLLNYSDGGENVVAAVVEAGNNAVRLNGLTPVVADPHAALDTARKEAFADARRAAELYAAAAGAQLGSVLSITEGDSNSGNPAPIMTRAMMSGAPSIKIEPGQSSLSASVSVTFELN